MSQTPIALGIVSKENGLKVTCIAPFLRKNQRNKNAFTWRSSDENVPSSLNSRRHALERKGKER